jgi:four helix bundle protein
VSRSGNQKTEVRSQKNEVKMETKRAEIIRSFEDLEVYQRAYRLSLEIHKASLEFPKIEQFAMADQVRRASKSICANIAEGFSKQRQSAPEFKRFLMMALGSSDEMKVWISYCLDLGYIDQA